MRRDDSGRSNVRDIFGTLGNDRLSGQANHRNDIFGGAGNDSLTGGNRNDLILGGIGNDSIFGDAGNDRLLGGSGNDSILGGAGNDRLLGGSGNDLLVGANRVPDSANQRDTLTGGAGSDTFVLGFASGAISPGVLYQGSGFARITDFRAGVDSIQIAGDASDYQLRYVGGSSNGRTEIRLVDGSSRGDLIAVLENTSPGLRLNNSSFNFV